MAWLGGLELALGLVAVAMGGVVLAAAPRLRANQALCIVLTVDGLGWFGVADGLADMLPAWSPTLEALTRMSLAASPWVYGWFIAETLDVPATRWLRRKGLARTCIALAVLAPLALFTILDENAVYETMSSFVGLITGSHLIIGSWATVAAWQNHRNHPHRRQASAYLVAFSLRNIAIILLFGTALVAKHSMFVASNFFFALMAVKVLLLGHLAYLIYGVLSGQVLALDDQVRAAAQKGLVLVAVSAVFLVLTEGAEIIVGVDSPLLAILAAGVITVIFQPVHAGAHRLTQRLFPSPHLDARIGHPERLAMYEKQVRIAATDGVISAKEQRMLESLRDALALPPEDVVAIELRFTEKQG